MELVELSGEAAVSFLQRDPIGNVYPIYAALRGHARPVGLLAIGPNGDTRGVLVDAARCASETVRDIFIVSSDNDVVMELFQAAQPRIVKKVKQGVYLPGRFLASKENGLGPAQFMKERTYRVDRPIPLPSNSPPVREVTAEYLSTLTISPAFDQYIGNPLNLPKEGRFFGLVVDDVLLAIAECIVDTGQVAAIAQVFVSPMRRREHLGAGIVTHLVNILVQEGKTVVYQVEESNAPSVRLAESLGFTLHSSTGYVV